MASRTLRASAVSLGMVTALGSCGPGWLVESFSTLVAKGIILIHSPESGGSTTGNPGERNASSLTKERAWRTKKLPDPVVVLGAIKTPARQPALLFEC